MAAYEPYVRLAARLNRLVGRGERYKTILLTTGAEAVENARAAEAGLDAS